VSPHHVRPGIEDGYRAARQPRGAAGRQEQVPVASALEPAGRGEPAALRLLSDRPPRGRAKPPRHLADLDPAGRRAAVLELGQPAFRADQLSRHYFSRLTDLPEEMTDLPAGQRAELAGALLPRLLTAERELTCDQGTTRKTLWRAVDGAAVESVLMRYPDRTTMCVSSQAGCGMACPFCATGQAGLTRNLSAAEIVAQVFAGARALAAGQVPGGPGRVSNVVFMGMGEPLANYASVLAAVRRITDPAPDGLGISQRAVTVSTVGLVPAISRLAAEGLSVRLAVSLHAPDDELRDELVPVNRRWKIAEVLAAARGYAAATGRRVSIEYAMIRDVNDQVWRADLLASLLAGQLAHVNLIPLNPTPGSRWTASEPGVAREFVARLAAGGIPVTVRDTRGTQIDGACGQLAAAGTVSRGG
jgi:23S rRNA (adenine2503-C2)-methyltransferase